MTSWRKDHFLQFCRKLLIPDLREIGNTATAQDIETAVWFIEHPKENISPDFSKEEFK